MINGHALSHRRGGRSVVRLHLFAGLLSRFSRGSIQSQHRAPRKQTIPPRLMPNCQWKYWLTHGVTTGASNPPPLPPVLTIAAAVPPRLPPNSTAVDQKDPSHAPTAPRAKLNQATIHIGSFAITPKPSRTAPVIMPASGTI